MTYVSYRIDQLAEEAPHGKNIRTIGILVKKDDKYFLRDPLGNEKIGMFLNDVESKKLEVGKMYEVFGMFYNWYIYIDKAIPIEASTDLLIRYKVLISEERRRLMIFE